MLSSVHWASLLSSVYWDLDVAPYRVGCKALGLIEELVTGPPWKIISKEKDVVNMYAHYQDFLSSFKSSVDDASAFGKGNKTASFGNNFQWIGCSNQTDAI